MRITCMKYEVPEIDEGTEFTPGSVDYTICIDYWAKSKIQKYEVLNYTPISLFAKVSLMLREGEVKDIQYHCYEFYGEDYEIVDITKERAEEFINLITLYAKEKVNSFYVEMERITLDELIERGFIPQINYLEGEVA